MSTDNRLSKFTKEQLQSFDEIEMRALAAPSEIDSLKYILTEIYRFGNYVVERITFGGKKCIKLKAKYDLTDLNISNMLDGIEEYWDELTIQERIYVDKLRRLYEYKIEMQQLASLFPNIPTWKRIKITQRQHQENTKEERETHTDRLKNFGRGELQRELEPLAKEFNLECGESVPAKRVRLITKRLIKEGWDANDQSVAEALRKLGYVRGKRK